MFGKRTPAHLQLWTDAQKRFHLSGAQVQMAREIGLNPKKLGKIANHNQEPWKMLLPQFIEYLYYKRQERRCQESNLTNGGVEAEFKRKVNG